MEDPSRGKRLYAIGLLSLQAAERLLKETANGSQNNSYDHIAGLSSGIARHSEIG